MKLTYILSAIALTLASCSKAGNDAEVNANNTEGETSDSITAQVKTLDDVPQAETETQAEQPSKEEINAKLSDLAGKNFGINHRLLIDKNKKQDAMLAKAFDEGKFFTAIKASLILKNGAPIDSLDMTNSEAIRCAKAIAKFVVENESKYDCHFDIDALYESYTDAFKNPDKSKASEITKEFMATITPLQK